MFTSIKNPGSVVWLNDTTILHANLTDSDSETQFWIAPVDNTDAAYKALTVPGPVDVLKVRLVDSIIHYVFAATAYPNGTIYNPHKVKKPLASGLVYDSLYVRHWDTYITPEKSSLLTVLPGPSYAAGRLSPSRDGPSGWMTTRTGKPYFRANSKSRSSCAGTAMMAPVP